MRNLKLWLATLLAIVSADTFGQSSSGGNAYTPFPPFTITSPSNNQCFVYQSSTSTWVNGSCAAGSGVTATGSPVNGNLTKWSGAGTISNADLTGDCTTAGATVTTCLKTNGTSFGTFATASAATPPAIGGTTPAAGTFSSLKDTGITGSTQCLHVDTTGALSGTGSDCGSGGGSSAWNLLTSGINTTFAALVGTGASLGPTGAGTIIATTVNGLTVTTGKTLTASNSLTLAGTDGTTMTFPGASGTVDTLNSTQTFTAPKTFTNSDLLLLGSSTGATTFASANASATSYTATWPANTGTLAELNLAQTWSATQTLANLTLSGITGSIQCLHVSTAGVVSGTGSDCGSGGSTPSGADQTVLGNGSGSTATMVALHLSGNLLATATGLSTSQAVNTLTATSYAVCAVAPCTSGSYTGGGANPTDSGSLLTFNNASAVAVTLSAATATGFTASFSFDVWNYGAGTVTITPTTSTIGGSSTLTIAQNTGCTVTSDGTNYQLSNCLSKFSGGAGSGTITSSTAGQVPVYTAATTVAGGANFTASAGALSLGVSGTAGSVKMGNATSGTVQLQPVTGALGTVTASLPANTGTLAELNLAQTWSATQTLSNLTLSGITGSTQCLQANTSGVVSGTGSACGSGGGLPSIANQTVLGNGSGSTATAVALTLGGNLVATSTGLGTSQSINAQTGTSYALQATDAGKLVTFSNASAIAVSLSVATTTGFTAGFSFDVENLGVGSVTITPTTSTINGATTLVIAQNQGCTVTSDGTNYQVSACTAVGGGGGSGTITSSTSGQIPVYTAATTVAGSANATLTAGALTLGVSGTAGSVKMGNATSGTVTVQPVTGALGTVTASLPANTGTVGELNLAQTWSALQTFGTNISIGGVTVAGATGTGNNVFATSPTLTTPNLGTPSALVLTSATGTPTSIGLANGTGLPLTGLAAQAAGTVVMNATGGSASPTAVTTVSYLIDAGTTFTLSTGTGACATTSTLTGGTTVGTFVCTGTTGASTQIVTLPVAGHGWVCDFHDITTTTNTLVQSAIGTTSATMAGTVNASDVVAFKCAGFK